MPFIKHSTIIYINMHLLVNDELVELLDVYGFVDDSVCSASPQQATSSLD